jgi:hypothetical protein
MSEAAPRLVGLLAAAVLATGALGGCGDDAQEQSSSPTPREQLLQREDLGLEVGGVEEDELGAVSPSGCVGYVDWMDQEGWRHAGREFYNTEPGQEWRVNSIVIRTPDDRAAAELTEFRDGLEECRRFDVVPTVKDSDDRFTYKTTTKAGVVDAYGGTVVVDSDTLVQVVVSGLHGKAAMPDKLDTLLRKAVDRAD